MNNKKSFFCRKCGKIIETKKDTMECCGDRMVLTDNFEDICINTFTAEHVRMSDDMDPCDDNRSGGLR